VYHKLKNSEPLEANISCLKRAFGLARCTWRGLDHFKAYVWSSVRCLQTLPCWYASSRHTRQIKLQAGPSLGRRYRCHARQTISAALDLPLQRVILGQSARKPFAHPSPICHTIIALNPRCGGLQCPSTNAKLLKYPFELRFPRVKLSGIGYGWRPAT